MRDISVNLNDHRLTVVEEPAMKLKRDGSGPVLDREGAAQFVVSVFAKRIAMPGEFAPKGEELRMLLTGARTEELRALTWSHVDLDGDPEAKPPVVPYVMVWRSVREDGDTKTQKSRRSLALPTRCVEVLREHRVEQAERQQKTGERWTDNDLVFASRVGTELNPGNVRRGFRRVVENAGLNRADWTPRELRHSFVSLLSDSGVPVEKISLLVGHKGSHVTELVYRKQLRPVVEDGATVMDDLFRTRDQ